MKLFIEVKAAEGGEDSNLFRKDLIKAYSKLCEKSGWKYRISSESVNSSTLEVIGNNISVLLNESGGHRIQRVPPTEKKGRVHTSTVVVAVYENNSTTISVNDSDIRVEWFSGTGKGGQHRNKHQNSCRLIHVPSGITASAQTRSRKNSYDLAYSTLIERINEIKVNSDTAKLSKDKKDKFGSGERGDKIRTYRFQDDIVKDHRSNKSMSCSSIMNGDFNKIW